MFNLDEKEQVTYRSSKQFGFNVPQKIFQGDRTLIYSLIPKSRPETLGLDDHWVDQS